MKSTRVLRPAALFLALLAPFRAPCADPTVIPRSDQVTFRVGDATVAPGQLNVSLPIFVQIDDRGPYINEFVLHFLINPWLMGNVSISGAQAPDVFEVDTTYNSDGMPVVSARVVLSAGETIDFSRVLGPEHQGLVASISFCVPRKAARGSHPVSLVDPSPASLKVNRFTAIRNCPDSPTGLCEEDFQPMLMPGTLAITGAVVNSPECVVEPPRDPILFSLGCVTAAPGETSVSAPLHISVGEGRYIVNFQAAIQYDPRAIGGVSIRATREATSFLFSDQSWQIESGTIWVEASYLASEGSADTPIGSENDGEVARLEFCVLPTAAAGAHPLMILPVAHNGRYEELITDYNSSPLNRPILESGMLTVAGEPVAGGDCQPDIHLEPLKATFKLGEASGVPGGEVVVPLSIDANRGVPGYSFSIDFDEEVLQATHIERMFPLPHEPMEFEFEVFRYDNSNEVPGSNGVDEGYLVGAAIFGASPGVMMYLPAATADPVLQFHFKVNPDAVPGSSTEIRFLDGARSVPGNRASQPVTNVVVIGNRSARMAIEGSYIHISSRIGINGDIIVFIRGDFNRDRMIDLSDAVSILGFLFLADPPPACQSTGDVNDDSLVDVSDVIQLLSFLYLDVAERIPAPYPAAGQDPTPDSLPCSNPPAWTRGTPAGTVTTSGG